jgi:hypothetical protein
MNCSPAILQVRRAELERRIEELIALLDLLDGDENLEPYLADTHPAYADREKDDDEEYSLGWSNPGGLRVEVPSDLRQLEAMGYPSMRGRTP